VEGEALGTPLSVGDISVDAMGGVEGVGGLVAVAPPASRSSLAGVDPRLRNMKRQRNKLSQPVSAPAASDNATTASGSGAGSTRASDEMGDEALDGDVELDDSDEVDGDGEFGETGSDGAGNAGDGDVRRSVSVTPAPVTVPLPAVAVTHPMLHGMAQTYVAYRAHPYADPVAAAMAHGQQGVPVTVPVVPGLIQGVHIGGGVYALANPWTCGRCTYHNEAVEDICRMCHAHRSATVQPR
jgi:hypothetical protein